MSHECRVERLTNEAFEFCYPTHRDRISRILGIEKSEQPPPLRRIARPLLRWISPPLAQSALVLRAFWVSRCRQELLDDRNIRLRHMGAYPIRARVMAAFLKAWSYLERIELQHLERWPQDHYLNLGKELDSTFPTSTLIRRAFLLLVRSIEDGVAYSGGTELLSPPMGIVYYLLWRLLGEERAYLNARPKAPTLRKMEDFQGEKGRYLDREYCSTRALDLLGEMIGRHRDEQAFTEFVNRRYYLHDAFSDPYVQGLWSVDYALVPLARWMQEDLRNGDSASRFGLSATPRPPRSPPPVSW